MSNLYRNTYNHGAVFLTALLAFFFMVHVNAQSQENAETVESATPNLFLGYADISGTFNSSFQYRSLDDREDQDIREYLSLQFDDIYKDVLDGSFSMLWHEDFNGLDTPIHDWDDPFYDIDNAIDNRFRFYTGYIDLKGLLLDESKLRLGRQYFDKIDYAHFDGATYEFSPHERFDIALFGGKPISFYSSTGGEAFYGGNVEYRVNSRLKTALRYYRYDADGFQDDLGAAELWYRFTDNTISHHEFSLLDGDPYLFENNLHVRFDSIDFDVNAELTRMFDDIRDHTINFNPYFPLVNGYEAFTHTSIFLTKGMGKYFSLIGSFDYRFIDETQDPVHEFTNRDYRRYTAGAEFYPHEKLTLGITGEYWDVHPDDDFSGITGEVEYRPTQQWTLSSGVDYGEYVQHYRDEFLFIQGQQDVFRVSPDVMTYWGRVKWNPRQKMYVSARFEVEDSDYAEDNWYAFRLQCGVNF